MRTHVPSAPPPAARTAPPTSRAPPASRSYQTQPRPQQRYGAPGGQYGAGRGPGIGGIIAGSFLGSALGSVLGNAISSKMYQGRNPDTGAYEDPSRPDNNPCKRELDYFLECARLVPDPVYCKSAADALKKCADRHKDYFQESEG
ncbi:hypothetical protein BsWGS_21573 [Bradybaena similaris]